MRTPAAGRRGAQAGAVIAMLTMAVALAAYCAQPAAAQVALPELNSTENVPHIDPPADEHDPQFRAIFDPPAGSGALGSATDHVAVAAGGGYVWAVESGAARVFRWDAATRAVAPGFSLPAGATPSGLAYYRDEVYVADGHAGNVSVYTPAGVLRRTLGVPAGLVLTNGTVDQLLAGSMRILGIDVAWQEVWINLVSSAAGRVVLVLDSSTGLPKTVMFHLSRYTCDIPIYEIRAVECQTAKAEGHNLVGVCATDPEPVVDAADPSNPLSIAAAAHAQARSFAASAGNTEWHVAQCRAATRRDTALGADVWDIATVPELGLVVTGCRIIDRGEIATAGSADELDPARDVLVARGPSQRVRYDWLCDETAQDGIDGVWGMRWLLAAERTASGYGQIVSDFAVEAGDPLPHLSVSQRQWLPRETASQHRDLVYQYREVRIEWDGDLKRTQWQHNTRCLTYRVTDADIYLIGARGEWFDELARGFQRIELRIGGTLVATSTSPTGSICVDLNTVKDSGEYVLELKAFVNNGTKTATATNPLLRIDNDAPSAHVEADQVLRDVAVVTGVARDIHSGVGQVRLEFAHGSGAWQHLCTKQAADAPDRYTCAWDTNSLPDGTYRLRGATRDRSDPPNNGGTQEITVEVDNDRDGDGIRDAQDACPDAAGPASEDGCPVDPEPAVEDPTEGEGTFDPGDEDYWNGDPAETHDNTERGGWPYATGGRNSEAAGLRCAEDDPVWGEAFFDYADNLEVAGATAATPAQAVLDLLDSNVLPVPLSPAQFILVSADAESSRYAIYRDDDPRLVVELMSVPGGWAVYHLSACGELVPADPVTTAPGF